MALRRISRFVVPTLLTAASAVAIAPPAAAALPAPVAAGDSAANIDMKTADRRVLIRWVARSSGTLSGLHLRIQADGATCRLSGRTGYGDGNGGSWHATTHPVLPDGLPDMGETLATQDFRPCSGPLGTVDVRQGIVRLRMDLPVIQGGEYATVIRNDDPEPEANYTSTNFLYTKDGIAGANGRNERSADAADSYYGLDPRELIGYSADAGRTWDLPAGSYPGQQNYLPTYLQEFSDGSIQGQPYYYAWYPSDADRTMTFRNIRRRWTIRELGAYTAAAGGGTLTLTVDGEQRARVNVEGPGMLRAAIAATTAEPGQTVKVTARGLSIANVVADTAWGRLAGMHLSTSPFKVDDEPNFTHAAPVYALPAPDALSVTGENPSDGKPGTRSSDVRPGASSPDAGPKVRRGKATRRHGSGKREHGSGKRRRGSAKRRSARQS